MAASTAARILRRAINAFLQDYNLYATIAALLAFPASASLLVSEALLYSPPSSSPCVSAVQSRVTALFGAAGFPASTRFFNLLSFKLSQTLLTFAATLPFTLTFLVLAKAAVVRVVLSRSPATNNSPSHHPRQPLLSASSVLALYRPLLRTHLFNYLAILCTNAAAFALMFAIFNLAELLHLSSSTHATLALSVTSGVFYSLLLAHVLVVCSLAVTISAAEGRGGGVQVLKAFLLIRGRASTAMSLAIPVNLGMAAVEALFQYKVVRAYYSSTGLVVGEAFSIIYIHSIFVVIDAIANCIFFNTCKLSSLPISDVPAGTVGGGGGGATGAVLLLLQVQGQGRDNHNMITALRSKLQQTP